MCVELEVESVLEELALLQKRENVLIPGENIGLKDSCWVSYQHPLQAAHRFQLQWICHPLWCLWAHITMCTSTDFSAYISY